MPINYLILKRVIAQLLHFDQNYIKFKVIHMRGRQGPVPESHHEATLQLMQILGMEMEEAFRYLKSMNFNLENAVAMRFNTQAAHFGQENMISYHYSDSDDGQFNPHASHGPSHDFSRKQRGRHGKMIAQMQKKQYAKTYLVKKAKKYQGRRTRNRKKEQVSPQKIVQQFDFNSAFSKLIEGEVCVTFACDIHDTFQKLWEQKKLVAIHCIKFIEKQAITPEIQPIFTYTQEIYKNNVFVATFNKYLINFGLDPTRFDFDHYKFMKDFVKEGDQYSIIILRYNDHECKVQLVQKLPISTFKLSAPEAFINLIKQFQREKNNLAYKHEKMSTQQKKRIQEDRKIREQQEIQYFKQLNTTQNQLEKSNQLVEEKVPEEPQAKPNEIAQVQNEKLSEIRRKNRQQMTIYPDSIEEAINFKIRLPSSESVILKLPRNQTPDYLFKFIENHQKDLGFNDETKRNFDIVIPLERISLLEKRQETFQAIFGKSEMESLVVKQI